MDVKTQAKQVYDQAAQSWHESRATDLSNFTDEKLLKQNRPHLFIEKPAMRSKLPDLTGKTVLCLGCGSGEECPMILEKRPKKLIGVDISEKLIEIAKKTIQGVDFVQMDAESLTFENNTFDYVYCSLMMDYFETWEKVLREVNRVLKKGGTFLFSNIHPIKWGADNVDDEDGKTIGSFMGFNKDEKTGKVRIYGDYLNNTIHESTWMKSMTLSYYTKPLSLMFSELKKASFEVIDIVEPKAIDEAKKFDPTYWEVHQKIPSFVIFECTKR